ncbi:hypothetical protein PENTCL1PPCAC_13788, partial [Pristionchus entomophagus]
VLFMVLRSRERTNFVEFAAFLGYEIMSVSSLEKSFSGMSNNGSASARSASGNSGGGGGGGIRGFFSKLRKPSGEAAGGGGSPSQVQIGTKMYDAHELQKLIPQLEDAVQKRDQQIRQQQESWRLM